jgi:hypothetical protein
MTTAAAGRGTTNQKGHEMTVSQATDERPTVSRHDVEVYRVLRANRDRWMSNLDIAGAAVGVAPRTVRAATLRFAELGVVDRFELFPGYRYRLADTLRCRAHVDRLTRAAAGFGVEISEPEPARP